MTDPVIQLTARAICAAHLTRKYGKGVPMPPALIERRVEANWQDYLPDARIVLAALAQYGVLGR